MRYRHFLALSASLAFCDCDVRVAGTAAPHYDLRSLRSGRAVKLIGIEREVTEDSLTALALDYVTDIRAKDTVALRLEAEDIWSEFSPLADSVHVACAFVRARRFSGGLLVSTGSGDVFTFRRTVAGVWVNTRT
jgi:hypothetical protein